MRALEGRGRQDGKQQGAAAGIGAAADLARMTARLACLAWSGAPGRALPCPEHRVEHALVGWFDVDCPVRQGDLGLVVGVADEQG
jgi:hypothetical protein